MASEPTPAEVEPRSLAEILPRNVVESVTEDEEWTVLRFVTGHELHIPDGMVIVHPAHETMPN